MNVLLESFPKFLIKLFLFFFEMLEMDGFYNSIQTTLFIKHQWMPLDE